MCKQGCKLLVALGLLYCLHLGRAQSSEPKALQTAASILALPEEESRRAQPAILHGVVTGTTDFGVFIQDDTAGIWVEGSLPIGLIPGEKLEVKGSTGPGLFSPVVVADSVVKLGRAPLPRPKRVTFKQLLAGDLDAQYVSITGTIRSVWLRPNVAPGQQVWLRIAMPDGLVFASLPRDVAETARKLVGAVVRVDAPATCTKNLNRQVTSVLLAAGSINNLTIIQPPPKDLFAEPVTAIGNLMKYRSGTDSDHRVRVTGTVTYYRPAEQLILEDQGRALRIATTQVSDVKPGDRVDAVGYPTPAPSGPFLQDAVFRYVGQGQPPKPSPVTVANLSSGTLNYNLISVEAKLLHRIIEPSGQVLLLQNGSTLLRAELDDVKNDDALAHIQDGSILRISGICVVDVKGSWNSGGPTASAVSFTILLRTTNDVQQIKPPSWWTATHLFYLAAILGILTFVFFALALYGRMEQVKLGAILKERERLAHEIHDTLAQSFAGIGFQIQAVRRAIPDELPELRKQVDLARALVRHSHTEARRAIEPVREASLENVDLLTTLEASARKMVEGGSVDVSATSSGRLMYPLPGTIKDALLHIGQEAIANAVRHADPSHLTIDLAFERNYVRLTVRDDGCGFEETGDLLGFGLRGMRKRSAAITAKLEIVTSPGNGTQVQVICPVPSQATLATSLKRGLKFFIGERTT
jgi:signal transduction histidine kinase